jgi:hypothetical protein
VSLACCILFVKLINYSNSNPPPPNLQLFFNSCEFSPLGDQQNPVRTRTNDFREENDFKEKTISAIAIFRQHASAGFFLKKKQLLSLMFSQIGLIPAVDDRQCGYIFYKGKTIYI